jgi:hypothetical protein
LNATRLPWQHPSPPSRGGAHLPIEAHAAIFPPTKSTCSSSSSLARTWPGRVQMKRRLLKYDLSSSG